MEEYVLKQAEDKGRRYMDRYTNIKGAVEKRRGGQEEWTVYVQG